MGKCGHEWEAAIGSRNNGFGCPFCSNKKVLEGFNDLASQNPQLVKEWHPTKNGDLKPTEVILKSSKKVWWLCQYGHEWESKIHLRSKCPICVKVNNFSEK